jgi:predicted esterase
MSINYRLCPSYQYENYNTFISAMEDVATAIDWIKANKELYRIDPDHITVGGHSAGAVLSLALGYDEYYVYQDLMAIISLSGTANSLDVTSDSPPCILIHGTKDQTIIYSESEIIANVLEENEIYYKLYSIEADHILDLYIDEVEDVITKHLYYILTGDKIDIPIRKTTLSEE